MSRTMFVTMGIALLLGACGGGEQAECDNCIIHHVGPGWATPPAPAAAPPAGSTQSGVFRDANVRGLDYVSGAVSGVTGADGRFSYVAGSQATFRVGGVTLGSFMGQSYLSPLYLPTVATGVTDQIENRLRFLQMLDSDGNPENGIDISDAVRARAQVWSQVDFTTAPASLPAALDFIRTDSIAADGGTHVLPAAVDASAHFGRTTYCVYSGIYRGTYAGTDKGMFAIVSYGAGLMRGLGYSSDDQTGFALEKTSNLLLSSTPDFVAGTGSNGATFTGEYLSPNEVRGTWANGADTGTFVGARSGGSESAVYRINGFQFPVGTALIMSFEVNAGNQVTGEIIDLDHNSDGVPVAVTGTLTGTSFSAQAAGKYTITGTFDTAVAPASRQLTGTMRDNVKGRDVTLALPACKLN